ncbi:calcium-binding protein [Yoonia sp. SS1-5]|uniref:Calcium-binding protein n=1 Tax=Yoonia rhodophyticola TaxID=3137370 RepID=A0AAN0NLM8_9RHOB
MDGINETGTNGNDILDGTDGDDTLKGGRGNDIIDGRAGDDLIEGGDGRDALTGGTGDDVIRGGDGNDFIRGGEGADNIDGGRGVDTATYSDSDEAVTVSLNQGTTPQGGGDAEGDVLRNIENLNGSAFNDRLIGNNNANVIKGGDGNDTISGGGGRDVIEAGNGDDRVVVRDGAGRSFDGGAGFDTLITFNNVGLNGDDEVTNFEALEIRESDNSDVRLRLDADQVTFEQIRFISQNDRDALIEIFGDGTEVLDLSTANLTGFGEGDLFRYIGNDTDETVTGTELGDHLEGRNGNDTLNGGAGDDLLEGGNGRDSLNGGTGDDDIRGGDGNDFIRGGAGADNIDGGRGVDTATYSDSDEAVTVSLRQGTQPQRGGNAEGDVLRSIENINGSAFNDRLIGNDSSNVIKGGNGNDIIDGRGGRDIVEGGNGDDTIVARNSSFAQTYDGGAGNDTLQTISRVELRTDTISSIENLVIRASTREDAVARLNSSQMDFETITFNSANGRAGVVDVRLDTDNVDLSDIAFNGFVDGRDQVEIVANNDRNEIIGSEVNDFVRAGGGNDVVSTGAGNDDIRGGDGRDALSGGAGDDEIRGEDGNDSIRGGAGADLIDGGSGTDTAVYSDSAEGVTVSLNQGTNPQQGGDAQGDVLRGIENIRASNHDDRLTGNNGANFIQGLDGDDVIEGLGGRDTIQAGDGDDTVIVQDGANRSFDGGAGFDTLRVADRVGLNSDDEVTNFEALEIIGQDRTAVVRLDADQVTFEEITYDSQNGRAVEIEVFGDGSDTVDLSNIALIGLDDEDQFFFFGDDGDETVTGTALGDRLEGRNGNDVLNGEGGNDELVGGNGNDVLNGGNGADRLFGQDGNDVLVGGAGSDRLDGGRGVDEVDYSASAEGIDIVLDNGNRRGDGGDAAGDQLVSIENVTGTAFADLVRGSNAENRIEAGAGNDVVDGLSGDDVLIGEAGNDVLDGGRGEDLLIGGIGDDVLTGGANADTFRFTERDGFGDDVVTDFEIIDTIQLLAGDGVNGFDDLEIFQTASDVGGGDTRTDTVIAFGDDSITLQGVDFALQEGNFDFFG